MPSLQEKQFLFVGGPMLTENDDGIRSKLMQAAIRRRRLERRDRAVTELNVMLRERRSGKCSCQFQQTIPASEAQSLMRGRLLKPKVAREQPHCAFCGGLVENRCALQVRDLGTGNFDPLIPVNEKTSKLRVREIFGFALMHIFPNLLLPGDLTADLYHSWAFPVEDELKLSALLWSAKYQQDVLRLTYGGSENPPDLKEQLLLKGLTLRALRKEVSDFSGEKSIDSIIRCMLVLSVNDAASERIRRDPSPFAPMFTGLHALEVYGSRDYNAIHWSAMQDLIRKFGGIETLRNFALAWHVSLADLTNAAHTLRKPIYPLLDVHGRRLDLQSPLALFTPYGAGFSPADTQPQRPGAGFEELLSLEPPIREELVGVFSDVGELSHAIDYLSKSPQKCSPRLLDLLSDSRDLVHHRLFCQPDEHDPTEQIVQFHENESTAADSERSREVYLACRVAMLLYTTHVTFPIPRSTAVRGRLLASLFPRLLSLIEQNVASPLLLWCASVALIALDGKAITDQVLALFKKLCRDLEVTSVDNLLQLLRSFAWVDSAVKHHYTGRWKDLFS